MSDQEGGGRQPPQAIDAEQAVLGSMMMSPEAIAEAIETLTAEDFYRPAHALLYDVMIALYTNGEPVDPVTVLNECTERRIVAKIGTASYLHTLYASVPTAANCGYYAAIVRDKATLRRVIEAGTKIVQMGYGADERDDAGADADAVLTQAQGVIGEAARRHASSDVLVIGDVMEGALTEIEAIASRTGVVGVPTGFDDLDGLIHGLHPGQLIVVAGRPGQGKSTAALDFIRSAALRHDMASVFFSLEMSRTEIVMRLFSAEARVPLQHLRSGMLTDEHWSRLAVRLGEIADKPFYIDDSPGTTPTEMRVKCRRLSASVQLRLVVVDYMQLMTTGKRSENRQQEVSEMSRSLKLLAKELQVPVVALSQLNRNPEQRADKRPILSDLRESGAVEQDADVVILLHREDYYDKESPRAGEADFIVAKQRNGPTGTIAVAFQGHYSRFVDMHSGGPPPPQHREPPPEWEDHRAGRD